MRIAVDAMGGDYAPHEVVAGALRARRELGVDVILVGDREKIRACTGETDVEIVQASQVIGMGEQPVVAVRRKQDASVVRAIRLVKEGLASAVVSAGNTGAVMAASLLELGRVKGIDRPALVGLFPHVKGRTALLDVGANVDCKPHHLLQFAIMGSVYAETVLGIPSPRVGLLNIGEEEGKGNELTQAAYPLLRETALNFIGNVEGRDLFNGRADVVVCDGFVGNVVLKSGEGLATALQQVLEREIKRNLVTRVAALMTLTSLKELRQRFDYSEYGGVPLLGINGVVVVGHGSSRARAIRNAVRVAREAIEGDLVAAIAGGFTRALLRGVNANA
ncbi:MAG TPA: phosphate acyltransferase PlsX [Peptococcaceae bacterium]|nr:phosphate acyltransferase PlsX [Peptococcaceae bacterium]